MDALIKYLNTYRGRDKALRTSGYAFWLLAGLTDNPQTRKRLSALASQFSSCRTVMRLYDDLAMFDYTRSYGFGSKEGDFITRWLSVLCNAVDQLYYPAEHVAWAADHGLVQVDSASWWNLSTFLWALSLYLNILKVIRSLGLLRGRLSAINRMGSERCEADLRDLRNLLVVQMLSLLEYTADLINAVHWLPKRMLWSGKLRLWQVGLLGLVSSLISAYKMTRLG